MHRPVAIARTSPANLALAKTASTVATRTQASPGAIAAAIRVQLLACPAAMLLDTLRTTANTWWRSQLDSEIRLTA